MTAPVSVLRAARPAPAVPAGAGRGGRVGGAMLALSVLAHAALAAALGASGAGGNAPARPPTEVSLEVAPPRPAPPPAARPVAPVPPPLRPPPRAPRQAPAPAVAPPPAPAAAAPPPDEPVDLTGTTLTAEGDGTGWASAVGNGAAMTGPAGAVRARQAAPAARTPRASGAAGEPPLVSVADLGRRPEPPDLDAELARRYPAEARRDGTGGEAEVRARVGPDGAVDRLRVLAATAPAFGDACLRMLAASRWTPPRDRLGAPCATEIRYTCRFEVSR